MLADRSGSTSRTRPRRLPRSILVALVATTFAASALAGCDLLGDNGGSQSDGPNPPATGAPSALESSPYPEAVESEAAEPVPMGTATIEPPGGTLPGLPPGIDLPGEGGPAPTATPSPDPPVPDAKAWCSPPASRPSPAPPIPDILGVVFLKVPSATPEWQGQNGITVTLIPAVGPTEVAVTGPCPWDTARAGVFTFDVADGTHRIEVTQAGSIAGTTAYLDPDDLRAATVTTPNEAFVTVPSTGLCTEAVFAYD